MVTKWKPPASSAAREKEAPSKTFPYDRVVPHFDEDYRRPEGKAFWQAFIRHNTFQSNRQLGKIIPSSQELCFEKYPGSQRGDFVCTEKESPLSEGAINEHPTDFG